MKHTKKLTAFFTACLTALSLSLPVLAAGEEVLDKEERLNLVEGKCNLMLGKTAVEAITANSYQAVIPVIIVDAPAYAQLNFRIQCYEKLSLVHNTDGSVKIKKGISAFPKGEFKLSENADNHTLDVSITGTGEASASGVMFWLFAEIPDDCKPGDRFPLYIPEFDCKDAAGTEIPGITINSSIEIGTISLGGLIRGDINSDYTIDAADAQTLLQDCTDVIAGKQSSLTALGQYFADVNDDGEINVADAQWILSYYTEVFLTEEYARMYDWELQ
ncbi:MAG: dockerin type I repeat-containing protein [Oscillospiraceae bacterium]|nr:dockerin type I repeat-containing protein [Oscillospiraceae bacterium]